MNKIKEMIMLLLDISKELGLNEVDLVNVKDLLLHQEYGLAFDTLITHLYEYDIEIDRDFYCLIEGVAKKMHIPKDGYAFLIELVRSENAIPKPLKDKLRYKAPK